jgi:hypothetical protein
LFPALGAGDGNFDPLFASGKVGRGDSSEPIILSLFAWLATFRFVLETFVVKKDLLAGSPNERLGAIDAGDRSILKVRRLLSYDLLHPAVCHCGFPPRFNDATRITYVGLYEEAAKN